MMQSAAIDSPAGSFTLQTPSAQTPLLSDVVWGDMAAFPTPAYWAFRLAASKVSAKPATYKLGSSLAQELAACLLGGHGIPASVGLAAFDALRKAGLLEGNATEQDIFEVLSRPLTVHRRSVRYRFAAQKARYLAGSLAKLASSTPPTQSGRQLRDWLLCLPGVGYKTASWVARNWLDADDVAILDVHILRVGQAIGLFPSKMTVTRHYVELEAMFLALASAMDVRASELDAVIWYEMASSPRTVQVVSGRRPSTLLEADQRQAHSSEAATFI